MYIFCATANPLHLIVAVSDRLKPARPTRRELSLRSDTPCPAEMLRCRLRAFALTQIRQAARGLLVRRFTSGSLTQVCDPFGNSTSSRVFPTRITVTGVPSKRGGNATVKIAPAFIAAPESLLLCSPTPVSANASPVASDERHIPIVTSVPV